MLKSRWVAVKIEAGIQSLPKAPHGASGYIAGIFRSNSFREGSPQPSKASSLGHFAQNTPPAVLLRLMPLVHSKLHPGSLSRFEHSL